MNTLEYLKSNEYKGSNDFLQKAQFLKDNWGWLKYSFAVAIKVRHRMEELGWTQKRLADAIGCTQQHISILLNGRVNMTLETISKLENALEFNLIGDILSPTGYNSYPVSPTGLLNEPSSQDVEINIDTSTLVAGYGPRKKKGPKKAHKNK